MPLTDDERTFYESHGIDTTPTFHGQKQNQGRIIAGDVFPDEGYAVLACGGTEVVISATILHYLRVEAPDFWSHIWPGMNDLQKGIHAIACEALQNETPPGHSLSVTDRTKPNSNGSRCES